MEHPTGIETEAQGRIKRTRKILEDIQRTVTPYPPIDVHAELSWSRETSKGKVARAIGYTSAALLAGMTVYGMIIHDQKVLLAVLDVLKYSVVALLAWALGRVATSLLPRSRKHDEAHEEDQDSG